MKEITSTRNELVRALLDMNKKENIEKNHCMLVESPKVVIDLYKKGLITKMFLTNKAKDKYTELSKCLEITIISEQIADKLSETKTTTGVFGVAKILEQDDAFGDRVVVLDGLQDPSNIGAIIRTAKATDFTDILYIDCAYPYSSKVVRSSMSHVFGVNNHIGDYSDLGKLKKTHTIITADLDGENIFNRQDNFTRFALVIGNEGNGVSDNAKKLTDKTYCLPMNESVESLNASVSAGILMYNLINNK